MQVQSFHLLHLHLCIFASSLYLAQLVIYAIIIILHKQKTQIYNLQLNFAYVVLNLDLVLILLRRFSPLSTSPFFFSSRHSHEGVFSWGGGRYYYLPIQIPYDDAILYYKSSNNTDRQTDRQIRIQTDMQNFRVSLRSSA